MASKPSHPTIAAGDHKGYMEYALEQARLSPPAPTKFCVGAVLVDADKNEILSTGYSMELPGNIPGDPGKTCRAVLLYQSGSKAWSSRGTDMRSIAQKHCPVYHHGATQQEIEWEYDLRGEDGAIGVIYVGIKEPEIFIGENMGRKRLEDAGVMVKFVEGMKDRILEVSTAGHEK